MVLQAFRSVLLIIRIGEMSGDASAARDFLLHDSAVIFDARGKHCIIKFVRGRGAMQYRGGLGGGRDDFGQEVVRSVELLWALRV